MANRDGKTHQTNNTVRVVVKKTNVTQLQDERLMKTNHLKRNNNNLQDNGNVNPPSIILNDKEISTGSSQRIEKLFSTRLQRLFVPNEKTSVDKDSGVKGAYNYKKSQSEIKVVVDDDVDSNESTRQECGEILEDSSSNEDYTDACPV